MHIQAATIKPEFYVSTLKQTGNGSPTETGNGTVVGGAVLRITQGITQTTQAAGDGNSSSNSIAIDVKEASVASALVPGQS